MILTIEISMDKDMFYPSELSLIKKSSDHLCEMLNLITFTRVDFYKDGLPLVFIKKEKTTTKKKEI